MTASFRHRHQKDRSISKPVTDARKADFPDYRRSLCREEPDPSASVNALAPHRFPPHRRPIRSRGLRYAVTGWMLIPLVVSVLHSGENAREDGRVFLWKVQSKTAIVHLLGSIHLANKELYPMNETIEEAFTQASILVVEANINKVDPSILQKKILEKGLYPGGETWMNRIGEKNRELIQGYLEDRGIPAAGFRSMRPWLLSLTLTVIEMQRLGYDPRYGMDLYFLNRATEGKKPILELESADFQIELLSGFPEELQELFLVYTIREMEELQDLIQEIMTAWNRGDAEALESTILESKNEDERFQPVYDKLFHERNLRMAARIREYLKTENSYFVVVGAGHLVGEDGILGLLEGVENAEYTIQQATAGDPASPL